MGVIAKNHVPYLRRSIPLSNSCYHFEHAPGAFQLLMPLQLLPRWLFHLAFVHTVLCFHWGGH